MTTERIVTLISLAMGLASFLGGLILWYRGSVEKRYAAERDFRHLQRNYEQLSGHLLALIKEEDSRYDEIRLELRDIKNFLHSKSSARSKQTDDSN